MTGFPTNFSATFNLPHLAHEPTSCYPAFSNNTSRTKRKLQAFLRTIRFNIYSPPSPPSIENPNEMFCLCVIQVVYSSRRQVLGWVKEFPPCSASDQHVQDTGHQLSIPPISRHSDIRLETERRRRKFDQLRVS